MILGLKIITHLTAMLELELLIGQSLLYKLGLCKYELEEKVIRTSKTVGNKKIGDLQILETKSDIAEGALHTYENSSVVSLLGGSGALRKEKNLRDRAVLGQDQPIPR